jgi:hypothetical protein
MLLADDRMGVSLAQTSSADAPGSMVSKLLLENARLR